MEKNPAGPEANKNAGKPVETDSEKIVRRHLENKDDQITDEDIRNVRIAGEDDDEPVTTGAEAKTRFMKDDGKEKSHGMPDGDVAPRTPWDILDE